MTARQFSATISNGISARPSRWRRKSSRTITTPIPTRRLRIGYLSPDFKNHCQQFFTVPVLSNHHHDGFEIFCYADVRQIDDVTTVLRGYADVWRDINAIEYPEIVKRIRDDKIDILVDLTMHMADCRRLVYALKPAPIQIAWLAYPGTTGMPTIDYRLTDPYLDPPGEHDEDYTGKSIRMRAHVLVLRSAGQVAEGQPSPCAEHGVHHLRVHEQLCQGQRPGAAPWGKVLAAIPDSRLILMSPPGNVRKRIPDLLGVDPGRVEFLPFQSRENTSGPITASISAWTPFLIMGIQPVSIPFGWACRWLRWSEKPSSGRGRLEPA